MTDIKHKHLWEGLDRIDLKPPQAAIDLYRVCAAAYCADLRLPRSDGYDGWTRQIELHVPVADPGLWAPQVDTLTRLLDYLSGDVWRIELRKRRVGAPEVKSRRRTDDDDAEPKPEQLDAACLLSGGLDSFIGAADAAAAGKNLVLVSHVPEGISRFISPAQEQLRKGLRERYPDLRIEPIRVTLNPPSPTDRTGRERTQRARSALFLGLGTLVATAAAKPLIVAENGFISLNVPLTPGRIGSLSTRTTHPYTMSLYNSLLQGLGLNMQLELPYIFRTKGEMLALAGDCTLVDSLANVTVSCANPNPRSSKRQSHCGYCVPCIIRRASMEHVGLDRAADYRLDIRSPGRALTEAESSHLSAFKLAIRRRAGGIAATELLAAGPLPSSMGRIADFKDVHDRGLAEVAAFLADNNP